MDLVVTWSDGATYVSQLKCFTTSIISAALSLEPATAMRFKTSVSKAVGRRQVDVSLGPNNIFLE